MFDWVKKKIHGLFSATKEGEEKVVPLVIEGTHTTLTAEPDDAELAAQVLLILLASEELRVKSEELSEQRELSSSLEEPSRDDNRQRQSAAKPKAAEKGTAEYYRQLAERIESAHAAETRLTTRFVAYVEQELRKPVLPKEGAGSLALLETGLYKRMDTVEREGGELKRRWQHCLADVTVRLMAEEAHPSPSRKEGRMKSEEFAAIPSRITEKE